MAQKDVFQTYLSCHLCLETFKEPVSLSCNHNFCSGCLQRFWAQAKTNSCPVCGKESSKETLTVNFTLKELADSIAGRQESGPSGSSFRSFVQEKQEKKVTVVCSKHPEDPKWFCRNEQRAVCPVCEFSLHQNHKVVPVEQAVSELKEQLRSDLKSLQDKRNKHKHVEETYNDVIQHSKKQLLSTETQIRAEFNKLHQFLRDEEESRLAALREEEEQKAKPISREMKRIQEQISSLSDSISAVEEDLQKDNVSFLSSYKDTQTRARTQSSLSDPQLVSGALIDVAKHLGNLSFRVWDKMKDKVHFSPVILDPNTASRSLSLSDDLTSVTHVDTNQQLPDNPERNTKYSNVFGSEGFSSGKHSWEVEVGDHPDWLIGLVKETFDRKGETFASPKYGVLCLVFRNRKYSNGAGKSVTVKKSLQKIRIQLDYDGGDVSFYNSEDKSLICTHRDTFTEKLFPYFCIGKAGGAKTTQVKICRLHF
ncbi:zinc-binding protein A33-like [Kryptolebias marmoratus]|uniref:Zinc-binding protein A33-like n=1 Tax=Kryptolebias marmoratus TaxID=37003 RepID=A0A3Q2ZJT9_KRYMA|nr:zinc-binding protein A33-like [Kryptolebias marmoratus]